MNKILQTADLVKFAKAIPPVEVHEAGLDKLEKFVLETKPKPKPVEEETPGEEQVDAEEDNTKAID